MAFAEAFWRFFGVQIPGDPPMIEATGTTVEVVRADGASEVTSTALAQAVDSVLVSREYETFIVEAKIQGSEDPVRLALDWARAIHLQDQLNEEVDAALEEEEDEESEFDDEEDDLDLFGEEYDEDEESDEG